MITDSKSTLFVSLQGLGNSIIHWPIIEWLNARGDFSLALWNNGSSKFYREFGYNVIDIKSKRDILFKLGFKKFKSILTPCPSWKRECLSSAILRAPSKKSLIHSDYKLSKIMPKSNIVNVDPNRHDLINTVEQFHSLGVTLDGIMVVKKNLKEKYFDKKLSEEVYIVFHPTASTEVKFYDLNFWVSLGEYYIKNNIEVYIISGPSRIEEKFCEELITKLKKVTYYKNAKFEKVCTVIANANYFVGLDSAMMHLAANFDIKLVGLWSFANYNRMYPLGKMSNIYLPQESVENKDYSYPAKKLGCLKRAQSADVVNILSGVKDPDFKVFSIPEYGIGCYIY